MPISQISMQLNSVVMALAGGARIFALLDEKPEVNEGDITLVHAKYAADDTVTETNESTGHVGVEAHRELTAQPPVYRAEGRHRLDGRRLRLRCPKKIVLHDVNLYGRPGQKIAFVGSTGAGKTTITNLINRFYDIQDGKITLRRHQHQQASSKDRPAPLSGHRCLQDTHLFTGTVMENIRYGTPGRHRRRVHRRRQAGQRRRLHPAACPTATTPC